MKRCMAMLLSVLLLMTSAPLVSADNIYNDDRFDWGEYACPHNNVEKVAEIPSTCIEQGRGGYTQCVDCKLVIAGSKDALPLADHAYDNDSDADCNVCGEVREVACYHKYAIDVVEPTCVSDGRYVYTCVICGYSYAETLFATGHYYDNDCDTDCNYCGEWREVGEHAYEVVRVVSPTCTESGMKIYACVYCGETRVEPVDPLGHAYDSDDDGECNNCGESREVTCKHEYVVEAVEPTCTKDGIYVHVCVHCGNTYGEEILPATGHYYENDCDTDCNYCGEWREVGEHAYEVRREVAPTCTSSGMKIYACVYCGRTFSEKIPALGHAYDNDYDPDCNVCGEVREVTCYHKYATDVVEPTCVSDGRYVYTCVMCGHSYTETLPATGHYYENDCDADCNYCGEWREITHDYRDTEIVPDCENSGYVIHTCAVCGDSYVDGRVDALGHAYELTESVAPTCVDSGKKVYVCAACGESYDEEIPATGRHTYDHGCDEKCNVCGYVRDDAHAYTFMGTVEPSCGEDGSDGYKCWECGEVKYVIIPATGKHTYSGVCDADCNVCGLIRESSPHNYTLTGAVDATCVTDGTRTYTCSGCGSSYTVVDAAPGHKYNIVITDPDCENGGYTTHTCSVCGYSCVDNRVEALGHTAVAVKGYAATCETDGLTDGEKCAACGVILTAQQVIPATGHDYKLTQEIAATCTKDGVREYACAHCGDRYAEGIAALGHTAVAVKGYAATCETDGLTDGEKCAACDAILTAQQVVPATGHDYKSVVTDPDCVNGGYTTYTCTVCDHSYIADKVPATGEHTYDNDEDADCNICGEKREVEIRVPGDANGDGRVNNRDLGMLQQYLNEYAVAIDLTAVDVNGDGKVNNRDLGMLQQHLNGWNVDLK